MAVSAPAHILDFEQALRLLAELEIRPPQEVELIPLLAARGRVLATPLCADRDQPPFDRATRDGYAVRAVDFGSQLLQVIGSVRAGEQWKGESLQPGTAIAIMTGAPVPGGADAVVMIEHVLTAGQHIEAQPGRTIRSAENIVPRGAEARTNELLLAPGTLIGAADIALAATCGSSTLSVYKRPTVAIVATGDELVEVDQQPGPHHIRNSNSYAIAAMAEAAGAAPHRLPITPDRREAVADSLQQARKSDLIVLSGGVSLGEYDLVEEALLDLGAEFFFTGVRMQPGKPVVCGRLPATAEHPASLFFGLPGNPVSTQVTFHCFVEPLLRRLCGEAEAQPRWTLAQLAQPLEGKPGLTRLLPGRRKGTSVKVVGWQGSGDLAANARADCYVELPGGTDSFAAGQLVRVLLR